MQQDFPPRFGLLWPRTGKAAVEPITDQWDAIDWIAHEHRLRPLLRMAARLWLHPACRA
jgi:hypothetical protein